MQTGYSGGNCGERVTIKQAQAEVGVPVKKIGHSLFTFNKDGWETVRFHHTDIAQRNLKTGTIRLSSGGWHTPITARHIREALRLWNSPRALEVNRGWFVGGVHFQEGIEIRPDGQVKYSALKERKRAQLEKQLDRYCRKIVDLAINGQTPLPDSGDCWICGAGETSCLLSHLRECYVHGSLLCNAVLFCNWQPNWLYYRFHGKMASRHEAHTLTKAVRRYFRHHLIDKI